MICSWALEQELFYDQTWDPRLAEKGEKPGREGETRRCLDQGIQTRKQVQEQQCERAGECRMLVTEVGAFQCGKEELGCEVRGWETRNSAVHWKWTSTAEEMLQRQEDEDR